MNRKQLSYFLAAYKHGGITAAAEEMYITPQGLSKTITQLESEIGIRLFERTGNRIYPTEEADKLVAHAKNILDEFRLIEEKRFTISQPQQRVRIPVTYSAAGYIPASFYQDFAEKHPEILLCFEEKTDRDILRNLDDREAELAILSEPIDVSEFEAVFLFSSPFCILMAKNHPLAAKERISLGDLKGYPQAIKGMDRPFSTLQQNLMIRSRIESNIVLEASDDNVIARAAEAGFAVGMVPDYVAEKLGDYKLEIRPMVGELSAKSVFLVWPRDTQLSPEAEIVCDAIKTWYA